MLLRYPTMSANKEILVVFVTAANPEEAAKISESAVKSRQAACATTFPVVRSVYWWEGKLLNDQESVVMLKTTSERFEALQKTIRAVHSYKVPEIIAVPVTNGLPQYLEWVQAETAMPGGE
jgi:periplasmic divalent cation tolerance protein